jgi:hypothetical protein
MSRPAEENNGHDQRTLSAVESSFSRHKMTVALGPIAIEAAKTRRHLQGLHSEIVQRERSETCLESVDADPGYIADCLSRFNIWVGSVGVFQSGEASLDYGICSPSLSEEVVRLLKQLGGFTLERKSPSN